MPTFVELPAPDGRWTVNVDCIVAIAELPSGQSEIWLLGGKMGLLVDLHPHEVVALAGGRSRPGRSPAVAEWIGGRPGVPDG